MAFGQIGSTGFTPVRHENGSAWNNQLNADYKIQSGYTYNIGQGELVYITTTGFLVTEAQLATASQIVSVLGVFWGCDYPLNANFPITGPLGHTSWVGGTVTQDGNAATAYVITDPTVVYTATCNGSVGFTMATANQQYYAVGLLNGTLGSAPGSTLNGNGTSQMLIDLLDGPKAATAPIRTLCLDPNINNPIGPNNNALCMIQNGVMFGGGSSAQHA